jgi:hypothetical protein
MEQGWELAEVLEEDNDGELSGSFKKEEQAMKNVMRWGFFLAGIAILFIFIHYFFFPFWPLHSSFGWRYSHFGLRMWPVLPFFGMLILFVAGILIAKYFFQALRDSSISKKDESTFCPYCGKDLKQGRAISEAQVEKL